ncbi:putative oxidase [Mycena galopus ATCC 62051]|nr:putative oxidase [Mycena galopus ATCC 62051]
MLLLAALTAIVCSDLSFAFPPSYFERRTGFSTDQLIDVEGVHAFQPPGPNDFRGPCPGLNALANHGYISRTGIDSVFNMITQSTQVLSFGTDFATMVGVLGCFGADLYDPTLPLSIGAAPPANQTIGGLLGSAPSGLDGTHNQFESDASPTRGDLYQFGNNYDVQNAFFQELFNRQPPSPSANYNATVMYQQIEARFVQSVANNPYFFHGPVEMATSVFTHLFVTASMSNHSATQPDGFLNGEVLKTMYGMSGPDGNLTYTHGHEQIPANWYRRAFGDEYTVALAAPQIANMALVAPNVFVVGGNLNGTNSYAPVDISDLTGGVYSTASLLEGNNAACFLVQATTTLFPSAIKGEQTVVDTVLALLANLTSVLAGLNCPQLTTINSTLLEVYPGYQRTQDPI